jgi:MFS family permease
LKTLGKLGLLTSLYFSQGLPFGFFTLALPVLMRKEGRSLESIGLANLLALPWALKFLWAPVVDRWHWARLGRRRSWIVPLQAATVIAAAAISLTDPRTAIRTMTVALFFANLLAATQDIATDGLAVEILAEGERGYGNSVQVAAYRVGMILGGGVLLWVLAEVGWSFTFLAMAAALVLATVPILFHRERAAPPAVGAKPLRLGAWIDVARRPKMAIWLAILTFYKGGEALAYGMVKPLLVDRGLTEVDISALIGRAGFTAGLLGALLGGMLVQRAEQGQGPGDRGPAPGRRHPRLRRARHGARRLVGALGGHHARAPHRRRRHGLPLYRDDGRVRRGRRHRLHPPGQRGGDRDRRRRHAERLRRGPPGLRPSLRLQRRALGSRAGVHLAGAGARRRSARAPGRSCVRAGFHR